MSEALQSGVLQAAVFALLDGDPGIAALGPVLDAAPADPQGAYALLGEERVRRTRSGLREHRMEIAVLSPLDGFSEAKAIAAAIADVLGDGSSLTLPAGRIVAFGLQEARAERLSGVVRRRVRLVFRALLAAD
ncbi:MAG: tail completion protein gp17 [Rubricella sp.]